MPTNKTTLKKLTLAAGIIIALVLAVALYFINSSATPVSLTTSTSSTRYNVSLDTSELNTGEKNVRDHNNAVRDTVPRPPVKPASADGLDDPDLDYNSSTVLNQGDQVVVVKENRDFDDNRVCTVGYVDHDKNAVHLASHCLYDTKEIYTISNPFNNKRLKISSSQDNMVLSDGFDPQATYPKNTEHDYGILYLDDDADVTLGHNSLSGERILDRPLNDGEDVCFYSSQREKVVCTTFKRDSTREVSDDEIVFLNELSRQGDSGGPLWLKDGGGFVGVLSANSDASAAIPRTFFDYAYKGLN